MATVIYRFIAHNSCVDTYSLREWAGVGDINGQVISCMFQSRKQNVLRMKNKLSTNMAGQSEPGQLIYTDRSWCYSRLPQNFSSFKTG